MICIIDYGSSNIKSIYNAINYLGYSPIVTNNYKDVSKADKIILPGVGTFNYCSRRLRELSLFETLLDHILEKQKPYLGICVGMQILARIGKEVKDSPGFSIFEAEVKKISFPNISIPHVGWNDVLVDNKSILYKDIISKPSFYFFHSYVFDLYNIDNICLTYTKYGKEFISSISKENVFGVQFHPEKSQDNGLKLLDNYISKS